MQTQSKHNPACSGCPRCNPKLAALLGMSAATLATVQRVKAARPSTANRTARHAAGGYAGAPRPEPATQPAPEPVSPLWHLAGGANRWAKELKLRLFAQEGNHTAGVGTLEQLVAAARHRDDVRSGQ